ncbi:MAG: hypothetical protein ACI4XL_06695 [Bacillus sp. (in: firmicutes)]
MSEELLFYSTELKNTMNPQSPQDIVSVQRGLILYRQELVNRLEENKEFLSATVQDVVPCHVKLDLAFPAMSTCTCKQAEPCRHQMAVFFKGYEQYYSISDWIHTWKNGHQPLPEGTAQLRRAKELLQEEPKVENTYESWVSYMKSTYRKQVGYHLSQSTYTLAVKWDTYLQRLKSKMPLDSEWKLLYIFISQFQSLLFAAESMENDDTGHSARYFLEKEAEWTLDRMMTTLGPLTRSVRPFAFDSFFQGIRHDAIRLLESNSAENVCLDAYRDIWTDLLRENRWRMEELQRLRQKWEGEENSNRRSLLIAAIHLSLLTNQDEELQYFLKHLQPEQYPAIKYWLQKLERDKSPLILFILEHMKEYMGSSINYYHKRDFIQSVIPHIRRFCHNRGKEDIFEQFCGQCLPYSFVPYSRYLLEQEAHKKWVELHLFNNIDLEYINAEDIRTVQQSDPSLLLPLYTTVVNTKIDHKNRQSYRAAVRYLKKIRSICKKTKRMDDWDIYMERIQTSHKRLRAFQEELKRGKLIDAE